MYSISFPKMFESSRTILLKDKEAVKSNLILLLSSDRSALLGDPYFGTIIKSLIYNQNDYILRDILIDEIYTVILNFLPQVRVERKDITVESDKLNLYANVRCTYLLDNTADMYQIKLTSNDN